MKSFFNKVAGQKYFTKWGEKGSGPNALSNFGAGKEIP